MAVTTFPGEAVTISGATFDTVTPGSNVTGFIVGGRLTRSSDHDCFFVDQSAVSNCAIQLPSDSEVGDVVEVYIDIGSGKSLAIYAAAEETFGGAVDPVNGNAVTISAPIAGIFLRKLTSTFWGHV